MDKYYIYCVLAGDIHAKLGDININGRLIKLNSINHGGISIVFDIVPSDFFLSRCTRKELLNWIVIHQQVLNYLYNQTKIIPFKVGTTLGSKSNLIKLIEANKNLLLNIFQSTTSVDEWNIVVSINDMQEAILKASTSPAVKELKDELKNKNISQEDLIEVGQLIHKVLADWKQKIADQIVQKARSITDYIFSNDQLDEKTLLSLALLTTRANIKKITDILNNLSGEQNLSAKLMGPMPPHSFYTLEVNSIDKESLKQALNTMEITGIPDFREIITAKRSILHRIHPDKGSEHNDREVQTVLDSFNLLENYFKFKNFSVNILDDVFMVKVVNPVSSTKVPEV